MAAIAIPVVLSGVKALLRCRERVDAALSLSAATQGLPFRLPPPPKDPWPQLEAMLAFFQTEHGRAVLAFQGLSSAFDSVLQSYQARRDASEIAQALDDCFALYFEACDIDARVLLPPGTAPAQLRQYAASGPSEEMRLAYYVVESSRLSRNPVLTRIVLIVADSLLEVVGQNAGTFVANPKTRPLIEALLKEFAVDNNFDDESAAAIFRELLGATAFAALDNPGVLPNQPALTALYSSLNDTRKALKNKYGDQQAADILARLVSREGFERVVNAYMTQAGKDPSFITSSEFARKAISAALMEVQDKFFDVFKDDPAARYRVLEAVIAVGADHVDEVLKKDAAPGRPLTAAVLAAVVTQVRAQANTHALVGELARGELLGGLYAVALTAVANNRQALADEAKVSDFVRDLVTAVAGSLAQLPPALQLARDSLNQLLATGLAVLASHPSTLTRDNKFAGKVVAATLQAAASAAGDGLNAQDFEPIFDAAVRALAENAGLAGIDDAEAAAIQALAACIADAKFKSLTTPASRKTLLLALLAAVSANPRVWQEFTARDLVQPIISGLAQLALDGRLRNILSEPTMVDSLRLTLMAASRRGRVIIDGGTQGPPALLAILKVALDRADVALGRTLASDDVPAFLERIVLEFLKAPFAVAHVDPAQVDHFFDEIGHWLQGR